MPQAFHGVGRALVDFAGFDKPPSEGEPVEGTVTAVGAVLVGECGPEELDGGLMTAGLRVEEAVGVVEFRMTVEAGPLRGGAAPAATVDQAHRLGET